MIGELLVAGAGIIVAAMLFCVVVVLIIALDRFRSVKGLKSKFDILTTRIEELTTAMADKAASAQGEETLNELATNIRHNQKIMEENPDRGWDDTPSDSPLSPTMAKLSRNYFWDEFANKIALEIIAKKGSDYYFNKLGKEKLEAIVLSEYNERIAHFSIISDCPLPTPSDSEELN